MQYRSAFCVNMNLCLLKIRHEKPHVMFVDVRLQQGIANCTVGNGLFCERTDCDENDDDDDKSMT
jgi:hypothetical protein